MSRHVDLQLVRVCVNHSSPPSKIALAWIKPNKTVDSTVVECGKEKIECLLLFSTRVIVGG